MEKDNWDWFDWLIIFTPVIINQTYVWYEVYTGGISMDTAIIAAIISAGAIIGAIIIKEVFHVRKNYKRLISALGEELQEKIIELQPGSRIQ